MPAKGVVKRARAIRGIREYMDLFRYYKGRNLLEWANEMKGSFVLFNKEIRIFNGVCIQDGKVWCVYNHVDGKTYIQQSILMAEQLYDVIQGIVSYDRMIRSFIRDSGLITPERLTELLNERSQACALAYMQEAVLCGNDNHAHIVEFLKNVK